MEFLMGKTINRDGNCSPVDALELVVRLAKALDVEPPGGDLAAGPERWTRQPLPSTEISGPRFRDRYLIKEVVRKYPGFDLGVDTTAAAFNSFFEDEALNASTNDRLLTPSAGNSRASRILHTASCKAMEILGRFSWEKWLRIEVWSWGYHSTGSERRQRIWKTLRNTRSKQIGVASGPYRHVADARVGIWP
jgi:hypothetical protein